MTVALHRANSVEPGEMQHYAAFHLGLHCLPNYLLRGFQYEGRLFNSGTYAPHCHMAVRNSWKLRFISGGINNESKYCLNMFTLSKVIESSNMRSRNTLAKIVSV